MSLCIFLSVWIRERGCLSFSFRFIFLRTNTFNLHKKEQSLSSHSFHFSLLMFSSAPKAPVLKTTPKSKVKATQNQSQWGKIIIKPMQTLVNLSIFKAIVCVQCPLQQATWTCAAEQKSKGADRQAERHWLPDTQRYPFTRATNSNTNAMTQMPCPATQRAIHIANWHAGTIIKVQLLVHIAVQKQIRVNQIHTYILLTE